MENPNCYFFAVLELTEVLGFAVKTMSPKIPFLKGDAVKFRAHFRRTCEDTLNTTGLTITMKIGGQAVEGAAYSHVEGKWDFDVSNDITDALVAGAQDVGFVLTRTATGKSTYVRINEAILPTASGA